ncbi:MAG: hypothetical protein J6B95_05290 [Oscillospiraceae bacterium]|nr:hypothetical protein [Oscillospiraceae bacterium]
MAYRIDYGSGIRNQRTKRGGVLRLQTMTAACLLIFTLVVSRIWPEGTQQLRQYLLPGEQPVQTAFLEMTEQLRSGVSVEDALTAFCIHIIEDARTD